MHKWKLSNVRKRGEEIKTDQDITKSEVTIISPLKSHTNDTFAMAEKVADKGGCSSQSLQSSTSSV